MIDQNLQTVQNTRADSKIEFQFYRLCLEISTIEKNKRKKKKKKRNQHDCLYLVNEGLGN